ncbi:MAG TPA: bi-domain-containing oxidoreductase [Vicinamibacteria bacterium]|nr:bi-domain-containing oxidoreductase [Vicinamibacteria bacterium]
MLQVAISGGEVRVVEVPEPLVQPGAVLVRTSHSLISAGTEAAALGSGGRRESLVLKAIRNPALVRKVVERVSSHGLRQTADLVRTRVSTEMPTGYSCAGVVTEVGEGVADLRAGDRVACAGAGYANHAAFNVVPRNLVVRLPESVSFEEGAFTTLGAIALQGVRRAAPTLGEHVAVVGLGLLGQITAQLLRASGAVAIGVDLRADRVARAEALGLAHGFTTTDRDFVAGVLERTAGRGADAVIVTAAGGDVGLLNRAFEACRKKGRVVLVGDVPIRIQRDRIYKKELDFLISTSYGPGRYDPQYEERGQDYPLAYVRWTEGRNLEEVLRLVVQGSLEVRPLIDATLPVEEAAAAYASLVSEQRPIGVLLDHHLPEAPAASAGHTLLPRRASAPRKIAGYGVGVVGYGAYFRSMLLPLIRKHPGFRLAGACARSGLTVRGAVVNDGFAKGTTDYRELLADPSVDVLYVATRHNLHYEIAKAAVEAGKAVFVEKPMTMTAAEGRDLAEAVVREKALLTVGFNRRFSPHAARLKELLTTVAAPKTLIYRVNAGALPPEHWLLDPAEGGGRLLGEGVHFFDFLAFLAGAGAKRVRAVSTPGRSRDEAVVALEFEDGSVGTLVYAGGGAPAAGKERVEVFAGGVTFIIDDYRTLEVHGLDKKGMRTHAVEKGQAEQLENLHRALKGEENLGVTAEDGYRATWCAEQAAAPDSR